MWLVRNWGGGKLTQTTARMLGKVTKIKQLQQLETERKIKKE
jgi:hypothetical protein